MAQAELSRLYQEYFLVKWIGYPQEEALPTQERLQHLQQLLSR